MTAEPSIARLFADDHARLDRLFVRYRSQVETDVVGARECFREFKAGLERHIVWEEELLFPAFEARMGATETGPTAVMREEHRQIRQWLDRLDSALATGRPPVDQEDRLVALLDTHNWKEEAILYPAIDRHITPEERWDVLERMGAGRAGKEGLRHQRTPDD